MSPRAILIAGPTASGKSALALAMAEATGGQIVNADSQQIYADWRVLTARPSEAEEAQARHRLYGHVGLDQSYSVGHWLRDVEPILKEAQVPVIVGGTGLYFKALTEGLAPIPPVPPEIREEAEIELEQMGLDAFAQRLECDDPDTAARIDMVNPRRVLRAWEVLRATGTGLADWAARTPPPCLRLDQAAAFVLEPPRDWLYARCETRFDRMLADGALEEVRAVMAMRVPSAAPGLRALGAPELTAYLRGETSLDDATQKAKTETRRYAKRQMTWMRNQMGAWRRLDPTKPNLIETALAMLD